MKPRLYVLVASIFVLCATAGARATEAAWARLATGGYTVLMTHALAPGIGDPPYFELGDCTTQRNLSDRGRQLARRQGVRYAARAVSISKVYASRWCRTLETAENAFRDVEAEPLEALDYFEGDGKQQTEAIIDIVKAFRGPGNQVMVTHPENIEALTGITPRPGEAVIIAPTRGGDNPGIEVVARLLLN
jgi:hypothetical protein